MRKVFALVVVLLGLPAIAVAQPYVDIYIRGNVLGRVPGKNEGNVQIRWDYKCLGDQLGAATYTWTLKVVRKLPRPEVTRTLTTGTTKTGSMRARLAPGRWEPMAEPFRCVTDRGAGSTAPEVGAAFVVPDYCAWSVTSARGQTGLEQGQAVRALAKGGTVRPGDVAFSGGSGSLALQSRGAGTTVTLGRSSRLRVDRRQCGRQGGWKLMLLTGSAAVRLAESDRKSSYVLQTANALTQAKRATWSVESRARGGKPWTRVKVRSGSLTVRAGGRTVAVRAGRAVVVQGSGPPSAA